MFYSAWTEVWLILAQYANRKLLNFLNKSSLNNHFVKSFYKNILNSVLCYLARTCKYRSNFTLVHSRNPFVLKQISIINFFQEKIEKIQSSHSLFQLTGRTLFHITAKSSSLHESSQPGIFKLTSDLSSPLFIIETCNKKIN